MAPKGPKSTLYKYSQLATIKDNEVEYSGAKILPWGHVACGGGGEEVHQWSKVGFWVLFFFSS